MVGGRRLRAAVTTIADPTNEEVEKDYGALKALCERAAESAMPGRVAEHPARADRRARRCDAAASRTGPR